MVCVTKLELMMMCNFRKTENADLKFDLTVVCLFSKCGSHKEENRVEKEIHNFTSCSVKLTISINNGIHKHTNSLLFIPTFLKLTSSSNSLKVYNNSVEYENGVIHVLEFRFTFKCKKSLEFWS